MKIAASGRKLPTNHSIDSSEFLPYEFDTTEKNMEKRLDECIKMQYK